MKRGKKLVSTMTQQILQNKLGFLPEIGSFVTISLDKVLGNDITTPIAMDSFFQMGAQKVFDKDRVILVMDHFTPNKDIASAMQVKKVREFAKEQQITHYYEDKNAGIEHVILGEKALFLPGECMIGADSHTCTHGAVGGFASGVGSTDLAYSMATGKTWLRVPDGVGVCLKGRLPKGVDAKDIILHVIGELGVEGARYSSLEFFGDGAHRLDMDSRFAICNMAVEAGAKNACFPVDEVTKQYFESKGKKVSFSLEVHPESYRKILEIKLADLKPLVAKPFSPDHIQRVSEMESVKIDQVFIGSCTNGRIGDLKAVYKQVKGKKFHKDVRVLILPGSTEVYLEAIKRGYIQVFVEAGAVIGPPSCGACLGGHLGILAEGEVCVSTTNRNFRGRMGHVESKVFLASPKTAAIAGLTGKIGGE